MVGKVQPDIMQNGMTKNIKKENSMKNILLLSILAGAITFTSCDPVEDNPSSKLVSMTADQINATVTIEQQGGKHVNKAKIVANNPLPVQITNGVNTIASSSGELLLFNTGENTIIVSVMNPDGTIVSKEITVNVDEMYYEVAPQYALLCGSGEKVWGNGGYLAAPAQDFADTGNGTWWGTTADDIANQAKDYGFNPADAGNATMTFVLMGTKIIKSSGEAGTFSFDMSKITMSADNTNLWAVGKLYTTGESILFPCQINSGDKIQEYDIMTLDENKLVLTYASPGTGSWGEATWWRFKAIE